jgi:ankyrin repeat protein
MADMDIENDNGETALIIVTNMIDMDIENDNGETALIIAMNNRHKEIVKMLNAAKEVRSSKQEAMELVRDRDVKIPLLSTLADQALSTNEKMKTRNLELSHGRLGGKRKTKKSKRSKRNTRKKTN